MKLTEEARRAAEDSILNSYGQGDLRRSERIVSAVFSAILPHLTDDGATPFELETERISWHRKEGYEAGLTARGSTPAIDREAPTRSQIAEALHEEGAYCGDCDFEDDWTLCVGCRGVLGDYADAVLKLLDGAR